jgi:flagellar hook-basal body complex protein FliE
MNVSFGAAAQAYAAASRVRENAPTATAGTDGGSFANLVKEAAQSTLESMKQGEAATMQGLVGKADISQVVTAVTNAEMSLQAVVAVRDKVIQSYLDIIRMPI